MQMQNFDLNIPAAAKRLADIDMAVECSKRSCTIVKNPDAGELAPRTPHHLGSLFPPLSQQETGRLVSFSGEV